MNLYRWGAVLYVLVPSSAVCQTVTMADLAREVVASSPRVEAQRQVVRQLRARVQDARSSRLPAVEGSAIVQRRRLDVVGGPGDQVFTIGQGDVEARLPIADGGRAGAAIATARGELASGEATLKAIVNRVLLDLVTAVAELREARAVEVAVRQQRDAITALLATTRRRLEVRDATATDVALAQARLASADAALLEADNQRSAAETRYAEIVGRSGVATPSIPDLPAGAPTLTEATMRAAADAPGVLAARYAAEAGEATVAAARAALAPSVEAVAGYQYLTGGVANLFTGRLPNDRTATYGGVSARIPLFQRGAEYAEIARAKAFRGQRQAQAAQAVREAVRDVQLAWARRSSAAAIERAAREAVVANRQALAGVSREAGLGSRTTQEVLDAQTELLDAEIAGQRAERSAYVARATVLSALGQLDAALLGVQF